MFSAIALKIADHAGLKNKFIPLLGGLEKCLEDVKEEFKENKPDLIFLDHWKDLYESDLKLLEKSGLIKKGAVIVGDNIICPGAPAYREYIEKNT